MDWSGSWLQILARNRHEASLWFGLWYFAWRGQHCPSDFYLYLINLISIHISNYLHIPIYFIIFFQLVTNISTGLIASHSVWRHPRPILRSRRAVSNRRPGARHQIRVYGRLCRSRLLQPGDADPLVDLEGQMARPDRALARESRNAPNNAGFCCWLVLKNLDFLLGID